MSQLATHLGYIYSMEGVGRGGGESEHITVVFRVNVSLKTQLVITLASGMRRGMVCE